MFIFIRKWKHSKGLAIEMFARVQFTGKPFTYLDLGREAIKKKKTREGLAKKPVQLDL
jgi:hypothetical protein